MTSNNVYVKKIDFLKEKVLNYIKFKNVSFERMINSIDDTFEQLDTKAQEKYEVFFNELTSLIEKDKEEEYQLNDFRECFNKTIYSYFVSTILLSSEYINHMDLATKLNISKTQLSNVMKIIISFKLVESCKIGKKKYYYITPKGREFNQFVNNDKKYVLILKEKKNYKKLVNG